MRGIPFVAWRYSQFFTRDVIEQTAFKLVGQLKLRGVNPQLCKLGIIEFWAPKLHRFLMRSGNIKRISDKDQIEHSKRDVFCRWDDIPKEVQYVLLAFKNFVEDRTFVRAEIMQDGAIVSEVTIP